MDSLSGMDSSPTFGDPSIASLNTPPYPDIPPQQEVDEFLKKKRKAREHKACYPCRQRKVKYGHTEARPHVYGMLFPNHMLTFTRCDLTRPCQTCRDRDHPELCSYHPPSKRQNVDQGSSSILKAAEESVNNSGFVTLGNREFDFLCRKLSVLESSIADLKREMKRNSNGRSPLYHGDSMVGAIDPAVDGRLQEPTHTDVHGVHIKNDAVSTSFVIL